MTSDQDLIKKQEIILTNDNGWSITDDSPCRVLNFIPMGAVKDGKVLSINRRMPYAAIELECIKLPQKAKGYICHKLDFKHLWLAFKERGVKENEEVIIFYTKKHYKNILYKILSFSMPRLWVMICRKGAYELITDSNYKPELRGEARFIAESPVAEWKPDVME